MRTNPIAWMIFAVLFLVAGCNQIGRKDEVLARVAGTEILESELEFALTAVPSFRRKDPDTRAMVFGNILENRLRAEAGRRRVPQAAAYVEKKLNYVRQRDLAQMYQRFFLYENIGHTDDQLLSWFRKNAERFKLDSGKSPDFDLLRDSVAVLMTLAEQSDSLRAYFEKNKALFKIPGDSAEPKLDQVRSRVEAAFIQDYRQKLMAKAREDLRKKYEVQFVTLPAPDAKDYYEAHKEEFKTAQAYRVLHLEMSDSARLAVLIKGIKTEEEFRNKAKALSENIQTKGRDGEVGIIKVGHCLPWGIGMMPALFTELDGRSAGYMTPVLAAPDTKKYHVFWLLENIPPQIKPYDRAKKIAQDRMKADGEVALDSNTVLVTLAGGAKITERDYLMLRDEVPPPQRRYYNREKLLEFLVDWAVYSREAEQLKLDKSRRFKALCALRADEAWSVVLRDSVMYRTLGLDESLLRQVHRENPGNVFGDKDFEAARGDAAMYLSIPDYFFKREFALRPERYPGKKDWKEAKAEIFHNIRSEQVSKAHDRYYAKLKKEMGVEVLDSALARQVMIRTAQQYYDEARRLYDERKLGDAREPLYEIRNYHYDQDSILFKSSMLLAQILNEEEQFQNAAEEFGVVAALWPDHPDAYKALFMKGFILSENLKQDSLALNVFRDMLKRYPKTDLSDDAEWMIRNIESGGKLVPALLDSIARLDSLEAKKDSLSGKKP